MSIFSAINTALSGMRNAQIELEVTGQNMTNVKTYGYTRQRVDSNSVGSNTSNMRYASTNPAVGQGVSSDRIEQLREMGIKNLLKAIESGILTPSTKQRLEELEAEKNEAEKNLVIAGLKNPVLTREQISFFIYRFRKLDITVSEHRQRLIDSFVNAVYVFDDKLVLTYNYKDGTETISLDAVNG